VIASEALSARKSRKYLALHLTRGKEVAFQHDATVERPARRELTRGEKVRAERIRRAWTQEDLARKAGLLTRTVSLFEQGKSVGRDKTLHKLSVALDIDPRELI
jgi:ribosome-binding protein aMBF1 (putative translation factor)